VNSSRAQIISPLAAILLSILTTLPGAGAGQNGSLNLVDVDGNTLSIADGHTTILVLTSQAGTDKARAVGDRTPDFCLGNPAYRMVTVLVFEKKHSKPTRAILSALIRHRLDSEGHRLQNRYDKLKIVRDARRDVSAVADFDGAIARELGAEPAAGLFQVFVFGKKGELLKQWNEVPAADEFSAVLKRN
jgi:hypothetical protein